MDYHKIKHIKVLIKSELDHFYLNEILTRIGEIIQATITVQLLASEFERLIPHPGWIRFIGEHH